MSQQEDSSEVFKFITRARAEEVAKAEGAELPVKPEDIRVPLFELDGKAYTIPTKVPPATALRYLHHVRKHGYDYAVSWVMEEVLGSEGYEALLSYDDLSMNQFNAIASRITKIVTSSSYEEESDPK